ncbi:hypothetical protein RHGRI_024896 [Rhododendron griersonianum]|uniref:Uncharacterized protein n=1 Tax=Rhododendron griersonianum TaxID=479676 RepID=A0AAV6J8Z5_9ERIC|nr:hypothetical protein RHGRI_024896 [Rhododendron griersonianum]
MSLWILYPGVVLFGSSKVYGTYAELEKHAGVEHLSVVQLSEKKKKAAAEGLDRLSEDRRTTRIRAGRYPTHQLTYKTYY